MAPEIHEDGRGNYFVHNDDGTIDGPLPVVPDESTPVGDTASEAAAGSDSPSATGSGVGVGDLGQTTTPDPGTASFHVAGDTAPIGDNVSTSAETSTPSSLIVPPGTFTEDGRGDIIPTA